MLQLNNTDACAKTRVLAAQKVASIEQKLFQLQTIRDALAKLVHQCDKKLKSSPCPIIQILELDADSGWAANGSKKRQNPKQQTDLAASPGIASFRLPQKRKISNRKRSRPERGQSPEHQLDRPRSSTVKVPSREFPGKAAIDSTLRASAPHRAARWDRRSNTPANRDRCFRERQRLP